MSAQCKKITSRDTLNNILTAHVIMILIKYCTPYIDRSKIFQNININQ